MPRLLQLLRKMKSIFAALFVSFSCLSGTLAQQGTLHRRTYLYVGQTYVPQGNSTIAADQMYVERLTPAEVTQPLPILFIHGMGMTGTNLLNTPDGRLGRVSTDAVISLLIPCRLGRLFSEQRIRSITHSWYSRISSDFFYLSNSCTSSTNLQEAGLPGSPVSMACSLPSIPSPSNLTLLRFNYTNCGPRLFFTPSGQVSSLQLSIARKTQGDLRKIGNGSVGDPVFDKFYASTVPSLNSSAEEAQKIKNAGSLLLDQIGVCSIQHSLPYLP